MFVNFLTGTTDANKLKKVQLVGKNSDKKIKKSNKLTKKLYMLEKKITRKNKFVGKNEFCGRVFVNREQNVKKYSLQMRFCDTNVVTL